MNGTRVKAHVLLDALAAELRTRGLTAESRYDHEPPHLYVANPDLLSTGHRPGPVLCERITAHRQGEAWSFHWSWGDPVCGASEVVEAADRISRALIVADPTAD